jgi:hypothetical protein
MRSIMACYRAWAKQLHPKGHALDTLDRVSDWSGKQLVKGVVQQMRRELEIPRAQGGGQAQVNIKRYMEVRRSW